MPMGAWDVMGYHPHLIYPGISHGISPISHMYILYISWDITDFSYIIWYPTGYHPYLLCIFCIITHIYPMWYHPCLLSMISHGIFHAKSPHLIHHGISHGISPLSLMYNSYIFVSYRISPLSHTSWGTPRDITPHMYTLYIIISHVISWDTPCDITPIYIWVRYPLWYRG